MSTFVIQEDCYIHSDDVIDYISHPSVAFMNGVVEGDYRVIDKVTAELIQAFTVHTRVINGKNKHIVVFKKGYRN